MKKAPPWVDEVVSADGPYPMSPKLVREILKDADLSTNEKVVFVYMVSRRLWCDKARVKDMADDLSMSEKMVARAIKTLEDLGHIYRQGRPRDRIVLMAPPWLRYDVRKPTFKTDIETDNVSMRHALNGARNSHPQTDIQTDNPPRNRGRVIKKPKKRKSQPKEIQNRLWDVFPRRDGDGEDKSSAPVIPKTLDELYDEYLFQMEECFGVNLNLPSALTGQNRGQWKNRLVDGLNDGGLYEGAMAVRLIIWDWERVRKWWDKAFGDMPYPTPEAVWKFADKALALIDTGVRGKRGSDRGPSKYAQRFLEEDGGGKKESPLDW